MNDYVYTITIIQDRLDELQTWLNEMGLPQGRELMSAGRLKYIEFSNLTERQVMLFKLRWVNV